MSEGWFGAPKKDAEKPKRPEPPRMVVLAQRLWFGVAALGLVGLVVRLMDRTAITAQVRAEYPDWHQSMIDDGVTATIGGALMVQLLMTAVYVLLAVRFAGGQNWARIVLTVFAGFGIASNGISLLAVGTGLAEVLKVAAPPVSDLVVGGVLLLVYPVSLVLMYHPTTKGYFLPRPPVTGARRTVANGL